MTESTALAPAMSGAARFEGMAADIEARIAATRVRLRPFPHLVVDGVLPPPVRGMLDEYWPEPDAMTFSNHAGRAERRVSLLQQQASGRQQAFWKALRILTTRVGRAARRRLERHLGEKFRPMVGPDWRRQTARIGYLDEDAMVATYRGVLDLPPHIDNARLVVNGFVYLDDDPAARAPSPCRGTMLYRSLGFAWPTNVPIPREVRRRYLREAVEVPWRDNRLLLYVNGPWSFHGVPPHDLGDVRRRLLMFGSLLDMESRDRLLDPELR